MIARSNFQIKNKKTISKILLEFLGNLFFVYCIITSLVLILFSSVTIECEVDGSSMYPTLNNNYGSSKNDVVFVNIYNKDFDYEDIVVINTDKYKIIKRVVGLPGDTINIVLKDNQYLLERNGEIIDEKYICQNINPSTPAISQNGMDSTFARFEELRTKTPEFFEYVDEDGVGVGNYVVPENSIFVLGDNRAVSKDSSYYGAFCYDQVNGKVEYIKRYNQSEFNFYYYYIVEGKFWKTLANLF